MLLTPTTAQRTDPLQDIRAALARPGLASSDHELNPEVELAPDRPLREAAVLIPCLVNGDDVRVVLTKRSSRLLHHPGQIAFPGGKVDPEDAGSVAAALREAREEIGLDPARVEVLGTMPAHETVTGYRVVPVVGRIEAPFFPVPEAGEVDEVFSVPLWHLSDPTRYRIERRRWLGGWRNYYTIPWGPYYIWGATARILISLARAIPR